MTTVLLHDLGDATAGAAWRAAAPADWVIPDLPGHGASPAPRTGHYDPMAAVALARWAIGHDGDASATGHRSPRGFLVPVDHCPLSSRRA